jgi:NAD(P)-dependent dehydrogenase (short-subunit alcohol dehydrogenase family)
MDKKIAFVTGANRGLGLETARALAENGVHVVIGSRDKKSGEAAVSQLATKELEIDLIAFHVDEVSDHKAAYEFLANKFGRLDILVNNAGVLKDDGQAEGVNRTSTTSEQILRETFDTNFFGTVLLTQALLPLLRKSLAGRIVNVSSGVGSLALHADPKSAVRDDKLFAYNASKTALNAFTIHLAHELKDTKIKVNSAHPGRVKTSMDRSESATLEASEGCKTAVELALLGDDGPTGGFFHRNKTLPW